jgi:hypothetical protein
MPNQMSQFLSALRGLEEVKTPLGAETQRSTGGTAVSGSSRQQAYDPNAVETEKMGFRQESLRRLKVDQLSKIKTTPLTAQKLEKFRNGSHFSED